MKRFWLETYGCQMNKAESSALESEMLNAGWIPASFPEEADLVILNTCSVRVTAEERIWGRLGRFKALKEKHPYTLVVMGCMAQRLKGAIQERFPAVDMVVGSFQKGAFSLMLGRAASGKRDAELAGFTGGEPFDASLLPDMRLQEGRFSFAKRHAKKGDYKALVPIMHGCDNFCSYCIVPHVRGREVSREPEAVYAEIGELLEGGVKEITLLGQNVNSYRFTLRGGEEPSGAGERGPAEKRDFIDFPALLDGIFRRFPGLPWLRFLTSHPKDFSEALAERFSVYSGLCRHIHLPVQHGSDTILKAMNRQYTRSVYLSLVERIREKAPGVLLGTDILIGFPGETDRDFKETLTLMSEVQFDDAFTYYYNPREGTAACALEDTVPEKLKLERLKEVIDLQRGISAAKKRKRLGRTVKVLVEEVSKKKEGELLARTEGDEMVVFPGESSRIGGFATVHLEELRGATFYGREVPS